MLKANLVGEQSYIIVVLSLSLQPRCNLLKFS